MTYQRILLFAFFFQAVCAFGQARLTQAANLIAGADSVVLISHVLIDEYHGKLDIVVPPIGDTAPQQQIQLPSLFKDWDVNPAVVVQRRRLAKDEAASLAAIVRKPVKPSRIGIVPQCFDPHHAILVYRRGHLAHIDLCFHCHQLATSKEFSLDNMDFKDGKWERLEKFFLDRGLNYEMPERRR